MIYYIIFGGNILWNLLELCMYFSTPSYIRHTDIMKFLAVYTFLGNISCIVDMIQIKLLFQNNYVNKVYSVISIINGIKHIITAPLMLTFKDYSLIRHYSINTIVNLIYITNISYTIILGIFIFILFFIEIPRVSNILKEIRRYIQILKHEIIYIGKPIIPNTSTTCNICYDTFCLDDSKWVNLQCDHTYHSKCIAEWFKRSITCPYCRHDQGVTENINFIVRLENDGSVNIQA